jgi:hypothetical protein
MFSDLTLNEIQYSHVIIIFVDVLNHLRPVLFDVLDYLGPKLESRSGYQRQEIERRAKQQRLDGASESTIRNMDNSDGVKHPEQERSQ